MSAQRGRQAIYATSFVHDGRMVELAKTIVRVTRQILPIVNLIVEHASANPDSKD